MEEDNLMLKPDSEALLTLVDLKMPFGKYAGRAILDMPEVTSWFKGFPCWEGWHWRTRLSSMDLSL